MLPATLQKLRKIASPLSTPEFGHKFLRYELKVDPTCLQAAYFVLNLAWGHAPLFSVYFSPLASPPNRPLRIILRKGEEERETENKSYRLFILEKKYFAQLSWPGDASERTEPQSRMGSKKRGARQGANRAGGSPVFRSWETGCAEPERHVGNTRSNSLKLKKKNPSLGISPTALSPICCGR